MRVKVGSGEPNYLVFIVNHIWWRKGIRKPVLKTLCHLDNYVPFKAKSKMKLQKTLLASSPVS